MFDSKGDLYSVKIMWPRTAEERARNRNTGFVCFMTRADAQEAMDMYQDSDPLACGRRMLLRWGKNVKKTVKRGTGGVPIPPIAKKEMQQEEKRNSGGADKWQSENDNADQTKGERPAAHSDTVDNNVSASNANSGVGDHLGSPLGQNQQDSSSFQTVPVAGGGATRSGAALSSITSQKQPQSTLNRSSPLATAPVIAAPKYDPEKDRANSIAVSIPYDSKRVKFITTVASFVAKDGSILERKLIEKESNNPDFSFLAVSSNADDSMSDTDNQERIFYRWRVYSFCQGDGLNNWRTEPFQMFHPDGMWWIPPPRNQEAAKREEELLKKKEIEILNKQEQRRKIAEKKDFMTGRQLEHAKFGAAHSAAGDVKLTDSEMEEFEKLLRTLCASRQSICETMAFCFDKSGAAVQISELLRKAVMESEGGVSIDTRVARLYLLSDVLFNSQQPGVRNAFRYRDAIEVMAPSLFASLGSHGARSGRMTRNKLRRAVNAVIEAWNKWSVYNPGFLEELEAQFEGKETNASTSTDKTNNLSASANENDESETQSEAKNSQTGNEEKTVSAPVPRGDWTLSEVIDGRTAVSAGVDGAPLESADVDGEPLEDDVDGQPMGDDDVDGEPFSEYSAVNVDGEPLAGNNDVDGEPLGQDGDIDVDGEPLGEDCDDVDGEPLVDDEFQINQ